MSVAAVKNLPEDWPNPIIKARLEMAGWNFNRIAREYDYARKSPSAVLRTPWTVMEMIVAEKIATLKEFKGIKPADIWPSRYDRKGRPLKVRLSSLARAKSSKTTGA